MQGNPETIIVAHYNSVRQEISKRMEQRDRILTLFISGAAIVIGLHLKDKSLWPLLGVIPVFSIFASAMYVQIDLHIRMLSVWLKQDYSIMLHDYKQQMNLGFEISHWDRSEIEVGEIRGFASTIRYWMVTFIIIGFSIFSSLLFIYYAFHKFEDFILLIVILILIIFCIIPIYFMRKAHEHRKLTADLSGEIESES